MNTFNISVAAGGVRSSPLTGSSASTPGYGLAAAVFFDFQAVKNMLMTMDVMALLRRFKVEGRAVDLRTGEISPGFRFFLRSNVLSIGLGPYFAYTIESDGARDVIPNSLHLKPFDLGALASVRLNLNFGMGLGLLFDVRATYGILNAAGPGKLNHLDLLAFTGVRFGMF